MRFVIIGGSDAGISAALRARELDASTHITVILADSFPNYSICGLPFYVSGETPDWRQLTHRTDFQGIELLETHTAQFFDPSGRTVCVTDGFGRYQRIEYDALLIATGARPIIPPIPGINTPAFSRCTRWKTASGCIGICRNMSRHRPSSSAPGISGSKWWMRSHIGDWR